MMTALFIGMLTGITVWWFLVQRLLNKPWTEHGILPGSQDTMSAPRVGLWVFLGMIGSLFLVFMSAYIMRMGHGHGGAMQEWVPVDEPALLWLNTALLVLASVAMQRAQGAAVRNDLAGARTGLAAAGVVTLVFLSGQLWVWEMLASSGQYSVQTPAYTFFILLTAVHGLHLIGGLVVLGSAARRLWRVDPGNVAAVGKLQMSVELCATYWHFLLLVWILLFWLLMAT